MKKYLFLLIAGLICSVSFAQVNVDSLLNGGKTTAVDSLSANSIIAGTDDSVNISELVQQQILMARLKAIQDSSNTANAETREIVVPVTEKISRVKTETSSFSFLGKLPTEYKILIIVSVILFLLVMVRRFVIRIKKSLKAELKKKISMLREEKVFAKPNAKSTKSRRTLIDNPIINKLTERNIDKAAKELSISKGELMLAARLKYLEYGKM